jgi:hypothetical protein
MVAAAEMLEQTEFSLQKVSHTSLSILWYKQKNGSDCSYLDSENVQSGTQMPKLEKHAASTFTLKMETLCSSTMLVNSYTIMQCHNTRDHNWTITAIKSSNLKEFVIAT